MRKTMPFPRRELPPLAPIRQNLPTDHIDDVQGDVRRKLVEAGVLDSITPGSRIAITAGSRGMGGFVELLGGIVDAVKAKGAEAFIIPAMGSHGGAIAEGQVEILKRLGVTEDAVGAPVKATMQTRALGTSKTGAIAHLDDLAAAADGLVVLGRTRTHPENREGVASGLLKMVTVGLGKQIGAQEAHTHGLWPSVTAVPELTMANAKVLCGVAVVENGFRQPVEIEVVPPNYAAFKAADERLLEKAKPHVAEIGSCRLKGGAHDPDYRRIVVLSLTAESLGNGLGIGLADFTTQRFVREYDDAVTYVNLLTATEPGAMNTMEGPLPLALKTDREAIEVALFSSLAGTKPRVCRIRNTACLDELWVSEALLPEVEQHEKLSLIEKAAPVRFNAGGNLF